MSCHTINSCAQVYCSQLDNECNFYISYLRIFLSSSNYSESEPSCKMFFERLANLSNICLNVGPSGESETYVVFKMITRIPLYLISLISEWKSSGLICLQEAIMIQMGAFLGIASFFFFPVGFSEQGFPEKNTLRLSE